jgi:hypothetical protein
MRLYDVGLEMPVEEFAERVTALPPSRWPTLYAALDAFRLLADRPVNIFSTTPELVALTDAIRVPGFPKPVLLYPHQFACRTLPGDFARAVYGITGTRYRCLR